MAQKGSEAFPAIFGPAAASSEAIAGQTARSTSRDRYRPRNLAHCTDVIGSSTSVDACAKVLAEWKSFDRCLTILTPV